MFKVYQKTPTKIANALENGKNRGGNFSLFSHIFPCARGPRLDCRYSQVSHFKYFTWFINVYMLHD